MEGWLEKESDWLHRWNARIFTLKGTSLTYREDESKPQRGACTVCSASFPPPATASSPLTDFTFKIITDKNDTWKLRCGNNIELEKWRKCINSALNHASASSTSSPVSPSPTSASAGTTTTSAVSASITQTETSSASQQNQNNSNSSANTNNNNISRDWIVFKRARFIKDWRLRVVHLPKERPGILLYAPIDIPGATQEQIQTALTKKKPAEHEIFSVDLCLREENGLICRVITTTDSKESKESSSATAGNADSSTWAAGEQFPLRFQSTEAAKRFLDTAWSTCRNAGAENRFQALNSFYLAPGGSELDEENSPTSSSSSSGGESQHRERGASILQRVGVGSSNSSSGGSGSGGLSSADRTLSLGAASACAAIFLPSAHSSALLLSSSSSQSTLSNSSNSASSSSPSSSLPPFVLLFGGVDQSLESVSDLVVMNREVPRPFVSAQKVIALQLGGSHSYEVANPKFGGNSCPEQSGQIPQSRVHAASCLLSTSTFSSSSSSSSSSKNNNNNNFINSHNNEYSQLFIVHGGCFGKTVLDDLWVLPLSENMIVEKQPFQTLAWRRPVLTLSSYRRQQRKKSKNNNNQQQQSAQHGVPLSNELPLLSRVCHTIVPIPREGKILLLGGFCQQGLLHDEIFEMKFEILKSSQQYRDVCAVSEMSLVKKVRLSRGRACHATCVVNDSWIIVAGGLVSPSNQQQPYQQQNQSQQQQQQSHSDPQKMIEILHISHFYENEADNDEHGNENSEETAEKGEEREEKEEAESSATSSSSASSSSSTTKVKTFSPLPVLLPFPMQKPVACSHPSKSEFFLFGGDIENNNNNNNGGPVLLQGVLRSSGLQDEKNQVPSVLLTRIISTSSSSDAIPREKIGLSGLFCVAKGSHYFLYFIGDNGSQRVDAKSTSRIIHRMLI